MNKMEKISIGLVFLATFCLYPLVPDNPVHHLDNPNYWGVMGYVAIFATVVILRLNESLSIELERSILTVFLAGMPLIYVADWVRFDGTSFWIIVELIGLSIYAAIAYLSNKKYLILLPIGIAGHGLWDLLHFNQDLYVPNWYVLACAIIDIAVGFYVYARFKNFIRLHKQ